MLVLLIIKIMMIIIVLLIYFNPVVQFIALCVLVGAHISLLFFVEIHSAEISH